MSEYRVNLEIFAGPLDLLLYLVRKDEVDIYDIPIASITEQYIEYIEILRKLDIDIAGEFLVMAATLMEIKSAMLLPSVEASEQGEEEDIDPRRELVRQLLEYKKFKDAANLLDEQAQQQSMRFIRPDAILSHIKPNAEPELDMEQVSVWTLLEMFDTIMQQTGRYQNYEHITDDTPIDLYQIEILHRLQEEGPMTFENIFKDRENKLVMVGLFLGMLELIREGLIWVQQEEDDQIYIKALTDVPAEQAVNQAIMDVMEEAEKQQQARQEEKASEAGEPEDATELLDEDEEGREDLLDELAQEAPMPEDKSKTEKGRISIVEIPAEKKPAAGQEPVQSDLPERNNSNSYNNQ